MIEIKQGRGFRRQMEQADNNLTKILNKKAKLPKNKQIEKEISKFIEETFN